MELFQPAANLTRTIFDHLLIATISNERLLQRE